MADLSITPTNVIAGSNAVIEHGTAGATITAGQLVYKEAATNKFKLSDSNSGAAEAKAVYGMALNGCGDGQPLSVAKPGSDVAVGAVLTAGADYYASETPGGVQPAADLSAGERKICVGFAKSTSVLAFRVTDTGVTL